MNEIPQPPRIPELPIGQSEPRKMSSLAKGGLWTLIAGIVFGISPIFIAFLSSIGGNMYDESSGGGAALWLMFFTIPLGALIFIVGLVILIIGSAKK